MVSKIRRDSNSFDRYQHNRDLIAFINLFADSVRELPRGWETKVDPSGKVTIVLSPSLGDTPFDSEILFIVPIFWVYLTPGLENQVRVLLIYDLIEIFPWRYMHV